MLCVASINLEEREARSHALTWGRIKVTRATGNPEETNKE